MAETQKEGRKQKTNGEGEREGEHFLILFSFHKAF